MRIILVTIVALIFGVAAIAAEEAIDWNKAQEIRRKQQAGQKLTDEERSYLEKAMEARRQMQRDGKGNPKRARPAADAATKHRGAAAEKPTTGFVPLTDMAADVRYKGQTGGLYGEGRNAPPEAHLARAMSAAAKVHPLDRDGQAAPDGKVVLLSVGMSNTTQEFSAFQRMAGEAPQKGKHLVIVDGAQGGQDAADWVNPDKRFRKDRPSVWEQVDQRLKQAGVTPQQVQAVWMKQARRDPAALGEFPAHAQQLKRDMAAIIVQLRERFANLRLVYVSSRTYAGYAGSPLNPEPYAYESGFAVRWLIEDQIKAAGEQDSANAAGVAEPVILWGPYLWSDGTAGRKAGDLTWTREDFAGDGTHPSDAGRRKVAEQLLKFFTTDATATPWFTANSK